MTKSRAPEEIGVVVIGRNEGERLHRCLQSLISVTCHLVYVDSGSTDDSVAWAQSHGVTVVALDMRFPFTAARARNAGFRQLLESAPNISMVQFVDGDCELDANWLTTAAIYLRSQQNVVCVCGRLRERFPERSIYNRLCDIEWDRVAGATDACGGIAMMKIEAFEKAGLFNESLIAGEEPELCIRMRAQGGRIWRLRANMALHDADMHRFNQWWRRTMRGGYVVAEGFSLYGTDAATRYASKLAKIATWSVVLPLVIVLLSAFEPKCFALVAVYPLQILRLVRRQRRENHAWLVATFQLLANFAEAVGAIKFAVNRIRKFQSYLIEYR